VELINSYLKYNLVKRGLPSDCHKPTTSTGQRSNPRRHKDKVYVGCGAGFGGDRPMAALKLLQRVKELNYLVLECLAERTLADRFRIMVSGGKGYDPRGMLLRSIPSYGTCYLLECIHDYFKLSNHTPVLLVMVISLPKIYALFFMLSCIYYDK